jgi:RAB protein geranylgeranyltransferase component A
MRFEEFIEKVEQYEKVIWEFECIPDKSMTKELKEKYENTKEEMRELCGIVTGDILSISRLFKAMNKLMELER